MNSPIFRFFRFASSAAVLALATLAGPAHAESWRFSVTPYLWATDLGMNARLDGREVVDETIPVGDLIDHIDTIFQVRLEATRGAFGFMTDAFDVTLSDQKSGVALPQNAGTADLGSEVGMTIFDVAGTFDPKGDRRGFSFLAGARVINNRATVDGTVHETSGEQITQAYQSDETLVDPLIGVRFTQLWSKHWSTQMQADASTGDTDYTWSAGPTLGYAFGKLGRFGVNAGYRRMEIDFQDSDGLDSKMTLSGFVLGFRSSF